MILLRPSHERGHMNHGWLSTHHTFSFGEYNDPKHMGFRSLRVINEDFVAPGQGFGKHPHRDMEIITYIVKGQLKHEDSMGNGEVITPGEVQHMSAGSGVQHSEFNPSNTEPVHLLQIWIQPAERGITPGYSQKRFADTERHNRLRIVASPDGADGSIPINQDASLFAMNLDAGSDVSHEFAPGRHGWVQVIRGEIDVNGTKLSAGDGAAISDEKSITITASNDVELLLFDLA